MDAAGSAGKGRSPSDVRADPELAEPQHVLVHSQIVLPAKHDHVSATCAVIGGQPALELGSLEDIRSATKGGMDPSGTAAAAFSL